MGSRFHDAIRYPSEFNRAFTIAINHSALGSFVPHFSPASATIGASRFRSRSHVSCLMFEAPTSISLSFSLSFSEISLLQRNKFVFGLTWLNFMWLDLRLRFVHTHTCTHVPRWNGEHRGALESCVSCSCDRLLNYRFQLISDFSNLQTWLRKYPFVLPFPSSSLALGPLNQLAPTTTTIDARANKCELNQTQGIKLS